jgi:hypothetical protein
MSQGFGVRAVREDKRCSSSLCKAHGLKESKDSGALPSAVLIQSVIVRLRERTSCVHSQGVFSIINRVVNPVFMHAAVQRQFPLVQLLPVQ